MHWVRARRKGGGLVALFALALQFTLSFGHVHTENIFVASPAIAIATAVDQSEPTSSTHQHPSRTNDYCAICATIYLLSSSFAPEAPQLLAQPFNPQRIQHFDSVAAIFIAPQRAPFQSRAPPSV